MFMQTTEALAADLDRRFSKVQTSLSSENADGLLVSSIVNILYLSGRVYSGFLYLPAEGRPLFLVKRPNGLSGDRVLYIHKLEDIPGLLRDAGIAEPKTLLLESDELSHSEWARCAAAFPSARCASASALLRQARAVKTPYELAVMKMTGSRQASVFEQFAGAFEPGMTDQEWNTEIFRLMLKAGSLGILRVSGQSMEGFIGSILVGPNGGGMSPYDYALGGAGWSPALPVGQSGAKMEPGMSALVDVPGNFYGYLTDCTRTYSVGPLAQRAYEAHKLSIDIEQALASDGVPGASCEALYLKALAMAERAGFADCFMGLGQKARFVGHGTGLVINEWPVLGVRSKHVLEAGMTVALEPKFVIDGVGAVGVEDTFIVTDKGMQNITPSGQMIREL